MGEFLQLSDLTPFKPSIDRVKAAAMIADVEALAIIAAPCLSTGTNPEQTNAVKAILRAAVLRWDDAGSGALQQQSVGPWAATIDTRQSRYGQLWPSEESALQKVCKNGPGKAFTVDMAGTSAAQHRPWCALAFRADYCSCGADIAGFPLLEP